MSYENFKPEVWSKKVQLELEKLMVFRDICNTQFQGDVGRGKTVKIIGVDRPKVNTYVPGTDILDAETPQDSSVYLAVDQFKYTHFMVDDIDGMQGDTPIMEHLMHGSATALAEAADAYIAEKVKEAGIVIPSQAISTAAQAKEALDEAFEKLWSNSVKIGMDTYIVVAAPPPQSAACLRRSQPHPGLVSGKPGGTVQGASLLLPALFRGGGRRACFNKACRSTDGILRRICSSG